MHVFQYSGSTGNCIIIDGLGFTGSTGLVFWIYRLCFHLYSGSLGLHFLDLQGALLLDLKSIILRLFFCILYHLLNLLAGVFWIFRLFFHLYLGSMGWVFLDILAVSLFLDLKDGFC